MKHLSGLKKKAQYYWMYYKWTAAVIFLSAAVILYFAVTVRAGRAEDKYTVYVVNQYMDSGQKEQIAQEMADVIGMDAAEILIDDSVQFYPENLNTSAVSGGAEKITTEYFAHGLDLLIAPAEVAGYYCGLGGLTELSGMEYDEDTETLQGQDRDGKTITCGLSLENNSVWQISDEETYYLCVMNGSGHEKESKELIRYYFQ